MPYDPEDEPVKAIFTQPTKENSLSKNWKSLRIAAALVVVATVSMFAAQTASSLAKPSIRVASRNFTEEQIAGNLYAQLLSAHGIPATLDSSYGPESAIFGALKSGQVDVVPDYLGNGLVDLGKIYRPGTSVANVLKTVNTGFRNKGWAVQLLQPALKFNDQNVFVTTKKVASKFSLKTLSDLAKQANKIRIEVLQECTTRADCLLGFNKVYKPKKWKQIVDPSGGTTPVNPPFYGDLTHKKFDVVQGYGTTDAQIAHFQLVPLQDNKSLFPPDQMTPFIGTGVNQSNPKIGQLLAKLDKKLTNANFAKMNARVAFGGKLPAQVAHDFLKAQKLI